MVIEIFELDNTFDNSLALISDVILWPLVWLQFDITKVDFRLGGLLEVGGAFKGYIQVQTGESGGAFEG